MITGFGRTGRWFGLERYGVEPDIIQFAKGITSGYIPLGGVGISDTVREVINGVPPGKRWMHAFTYSGHPTCCAVALKNIEILEREQLVDRAATSGARMLEKLRTLESLDGVGNVRGLGMMAAVEVVADKATKQLFPAEIGMTQKLTDALLDRGLYTRVAMDCICIAPPLVTTDAQIDRIVGIVGDTVSSCSRLAIRRRRLRQRLDGLHHRHQAHAFAHRDVLPEDLFDDVAVDRGDFRGGKAGERLVEDRGERLGGDPRRVLDGEVAASSCRPACFCAQT